jgi:hypothetical protein
VDRPSVNNGICPVTETSCGWKTPTPIKEGFTPMSLINALIPLAIGLLLVVRPQTFLKRNSSAEVIVQRGTTLRKIGYVLLGVAALYAVIRLHI